jgi:hypothetical protein
VFLRYSARSTRNGSAFAARREWNGTRNRFDHQQDAGRAGKCKSINAETLVATGELVGVYKR